MRVARTFAGAAATAMTLVALVSHVSAATVVSSPSNADGLRGGQQQRKRSLQGEATPVSTAETPSNYVTTDGNADIDVNATMRALRTHEEEQL